MMSRLFSNFFSVAFGRSMQKNNRITYVMGKEIEYFVRMHDHSDPTLTHTQPVIIAHIRITLKHQQQQ